MTDSIYLQDNATDKDIAAAIASMTNGGTLVLPKNAEIAVTVPILVKIDQQHIKIDLNGATLKTTGNFSAIDVYGQEKPLSGVTLGNDRSGNTVLTYDALPAGLKAGDWLKVAADDALPGDHVDGGDNGRFTNLGQAAQVLSVDGNRVTLSGALREQELYTTNVRAGLYAEGSFQLSNGHLEGTLDRVVESGAALVRVRSLTDTAISDITVRNAPNGIAFINNVNAKATDVAGTTLHSVVQSATSLGTEINGLFAEHVSHGVLVHTTGTVANSASASNYGADIGLVAHNAVVYDARKAAFDFHSESRDGLYTNVLAFDSRMFGDLRGIGNSFSDSAGAGNEYGVQFFEYGDGDGRDSTVSNLALRETLNYSFILTGDPRNNVVVDSSFESYGRGYGISSAAVAFINTTVKQNVVGDDDVMIGTGKDDKLLGGKGIDTLIGGNGEDYLWGGTGRDFLEGGSGRDRFAYNALDEGGDLISDFKTGRGGDVIDVSVLGLRLGWDQGDYLAQGLIRIIQDGADSQVQARDGENGWTTLATLDNVLASSFSAANLQVKLSDPYPDPQEVVTNHFGASGGDWMVGTAGGDVFHGSSGDDSYTLNNPLDRIASGSDDGIDSIWATIGVDLRQYGQIENVRLREEAGGVTVFGNDGDNMITGNAKANTIIAGAGNDKLYGKGGADTFVFTEAGAADADTIWDFSSDDTIALESRYFTGLDVDGDGQIDQDRYANGQVATIEGPQVLYDQKAGKLFYDADGTGVEKPKLIVTMPTGKTLFNLGKLTLL